MSFDLVRELLRLGDSVVSTGALCPWRTPAHFAVYLELAWKTNDRKGDPKIGVAWPSIPTIAKKLNTTPRSVMGLVRDLEAATLITVTRGKGRGNVNHYRVQLPGLKREESSTFSRPENVKDSAPLSPMHPTAKNVKSTSENVNATSENVKNTSVKGEENSTQSKEQDLVQELSLERSSEAPPRTDEHAGSASLVQCLIAPPPAGRRRLEGPLKT